MILVSASFLARMRLFCHSRRRIWRGFCRKSGGENVGLLQGLLFDPHLSRNGLILYDLNDNVLVFITDEYIFTNGLFSFQTPHHV